MAKQDKLITYAYLKEEVDIPQNIPDSDLEHKIYRAQEMLRMLMGDEFYRDFLSNYKANTLSTNYKALYEYIKKFVAWMAFEFFIVKTNFNITRGGVRVHTEENSVVASDVQMGMLIKDAKQQGQYYKNLLVDYLNDNYTLFSLYDNNCRTNLTGNSFHISAVKKNHHHNCKCNRCRC